MNRLKFITVVDEFDPSKVEEGNVDDSGRRQGPWVHYSGEDITKTEYVDGEKHGTRFLYRNDVLIRSSHYQDGRNIGPYEDFYSDGTPQEAGEFIDGRFVVVWSAWSKGGEQTLINGNGYKDDEYGSDFFRSVYRKYFVKGLKVREEKLSDPLGPIQREPT
ncbi:MAG: hypothetical protein ABI432_19280 [Flavobacteriales bacterium]